MPAGRPRKIKTVEELHKKIDDYFAEAKANDLIPTMTGLALAAGFNDRRKFLEQAERNCEFSTAIKDAVAAIVAQVESELMNRKTGNLTGGDPIFWLKNHNWSDFTHLKVHSKVEVDVVHRLQSARERAYDLEPAKPVAGLLPDPDGGESDG